MSHEIKDRESRHWLPRVQMHSSLHFTTDIVKQRQSGTLPTARMCEAFVRTPPCAVPVQRQPKITHITTHTCTQERTRYPYSEVHNEG